MSFTGKKELLRVKFPLLLGQGNIEGEQKMSLSGKERSRAS